MPTVSVVIPCYNAGEWIEEAVSSILAQTYKDYEIIIVNDGSTDLLTKEKLRKYEHSSTQVIHQENKGPANARNTGIRHSKGKYILALDADDMLRPTFLEKAVPIIDNNSQIGVVTCWAEKFGEEKGIVVHPRASGRWSILTSNQLLSSSLYRKNCWEEVKGYDEKIPGAEDWDLWISVLTSGWKRYIIQESLIHYRVQQSSRSHSRTLSTYRAIGAYVYRKYRNLYKKHFWKIVQEMLYVFWRKPYLLKPKFHKFYYSFIIACRDNLHPLAYKLLRVVYYGGILPAMYCVGLLRRVLLRL